MPSHTHKPPSGDRNFDDLSARFSKTIYDSPRGALRLAALAQDFHDLNVMRRTSQHVLDVGGGQGQFALQLAEQGAQIDLCDVSQAMLDAASENFAAREQTVQLLQCRAQEIAAHYPTQFDVVLNHAVLEWLELPLALIPVLCARVKQDGWLSLMFYNLHGHRWRQMMIGRVHAPTSANERLRDEGNSPGHPLDPQAVFTALVEQGFEVVRWRGIRCVYDHMHQKIRERVGHETLAAADLEFGLQEPYRQLGRYIHVLARPRQA